MPSIFDTIQWNQDGLAPIVAQSSETGEILTLAWTNKEALEATLNSGQMHYWSRSRNSLWKKGESSGQTQELKTLLLDCDKDALVAKVVQKGVACHTGRKTCFFHEVSADGSISINQEPEISPEELYGKK